MKKALFWIVAAFIMGALKKSHRKRGNNKQEKFGEDSISMPEKNLTPEELKYLHNLLIQRIYHEDNLLQMRNYNFITANVFLGAGYGFVTAANIGEFNKFGYAIVGVGYLWSFLQVLYGKMQVTATNLWRQQAWMAERMLGTSFDSTLYELYQLGTANTPFGPIKMDSRRTNPPYKSFPYDIPFLLGFNMPFAVTVPWMTAALWITLTFIMLLNQHCAWLLVPTIMFILLLLSLRSRTAYSQSMLCEYIAARHG